MKKQEKRLFFGFLAPYMPEFEVIRNQGPIFARNLKNDACL